MIKHIETHPSYGVSDDGRVYSFKTGQPVELAQSRNGCASRGREGYPKVKLYTTASLYVQVKVHHLVAEAFLGPRPEGLVVNHKDGNKDNNRADNLEYVTYSGNNRHAYQTGLRHPTPGLKGPAHPSWRPRQPNGPGEQSPRHKLTSELVLKMRALSEHGHLSQRELARLFNVSQTTVSRIVNRVDWAHI